MVETRVGALRRPLAVALVSSAMLLIGVGQGSAQADVTAVKGSAYGYSCAVTVFAPGCTPSGPTPSVTLAASASNSPQTASATSAQANAGPATLFSSGRLDVGTQGTLGPSGSVNSSANIANVNTSGQENFTATNLASTCSASEAALSGSTTITGGTLLTDNGDGDPNNSIPDHSPATVTLPASPAPNLTYEGHVHIGNTTDNFQWVFNEQIVNPDGSLTLNAAHQYLRGPAATGNLIIGQVVCGVTGTADTTPPQTTIDSGPSGTITTGSPSFTFSSSEAGSTFACKLDGPGAITGSFAPCTSPKSYSNLADGVYTFSVRATDAANNTDATPATKTFTVATTGPAQPGSGGGVPLDRIDPILRGLAFSPTRFRAAGSGGAIGPARKRPVGTRVTYTVSEAALVRFTVERPVKGRKKGKRCITRRKKGKRCIKWTRVGSFTHDGPAGTRSFKFRGRLKGKKLKPGRYRLSSTPVDDAGNRGKPKRKKFRIVR
jgi:hypothetical protein